MVKRGTIISLALLGALACLAVGATGASAKGTTAFTCAPGGGGAGFNDAHCKEGVTKNAKFEQVAIGEEKATEVVAKGLNTEGKTLVFQGHFVHIGVNFEFECVGVEMAGSIENKVIGGAMQNVGKGVSFTMVGCKVILPASQNCKIAGEKIEFTNMIGTTFEGGAFEMGIQFEGAEGKEFGALVLEGCKSAGLNGPIPFGGSFVALVEGATLVTTAATTEKSLTFGGKPAWLGTVLTTRMAPVEGKEQNPVMLATTEP